MSAMWSPVFASGVRYDSVPVRTWVLHHLHPRALLFVAADIHALNSGPPAQNIEIDPTSHPKLRVALQTLQSIPWIVRRSLQSSVALGRLALSGGDLVDCHKGVGVVRRQANLRPQQPTYAMSLC